MNSDSRILACAVLVLAPLPASGQVQPDCARVTQARLGSFVGEWRVETQFRMANGALDPTRATATISTDLSGCLLREDYQGERSGEPYAYVALWGANGLEPAPYQRTFAHSQHGLLVLRQGGMVNDTLVLRSATEVGSQEILEEERITQPGPAGFTLINRRSADGGSTWTVTRHSRYVRLSGSGG